MFIDDYTELQRKVALDFKGRYSLRKGTCKYFKQPNSFQFTEKEIVKRELPSRASIDLAEKPPIIRVYIP